MSSLNLVPNPTIMVIQAGFFLANLVVVKKFLLEPYLKVYTERVKLTYGSQDLAEHLNQENEIAADTIERRLHEVGSEARGLREQALTGARAQRDDLLKRASAAANESMAKVRSELQRDLEEQRRRVPELVQTLSRQLVDKLVSA